MFDLTILQTCAFWPGWQDDFPFLALLCSLRIASWLCSFFFVFIPFHSSTRHDIVWLRDDWNALELLVPTTIFFATSLLRAFIPFIVPCSPFFVPLLTWSLESPLLPLLFFFLALERISFMSFVWFKFTFPPTNRDTPKLDKDPIVDPFRFILPPRLSSRALVTSHFRETSSRLCPLFCTSFVEIWSAVFQTIFLNWIRTLSCPLLNVFIEDFLVLWLTYVELDAFCALVFSPLKVPPPRYFLNLKWLTSNPFHFTWLFERFHGFLPSFFPWPPGAVLSQYYIRFDRL